MIVTKFNNETVVDRVINNTLRFPLPQLKTDQSKAANKSSSIQQICDPASTSEIKLVLLILILTLISSRATICSPQSLFQIILLRQFHFTHTEAKGVVCAASWHMHYHLIKQYINKNSGTGFASCRAVQPPLHVLILSSDFD